MFSDKFGNVWQIKYDHGSLSLSLSRKMHGVLHTDNTQTHMYITH